MLVHIIADYGPAGDLAFAEVVQRLRCHLPDAEPVVTPVPAFATLAAGFCVAQLGLNEAPAGTIIYHNVAPRRDVEEAREANAGERLIHTAVEHRSEKLGTKGDNHYPGAAPARSWNGRSIASAMAAGAIVSATLPGGLHQESGASSATRSAGTMTSSRTEASSSRRVRRRWRHEVLRGFGAIGASSISPAPWGAVPPLLGGAEGRRAPGYGL